MFQVSCPSLCVFICKEEENVNMAAILLCSSFPNVLRALKTKQDNKILEMESSGPQHSSITDKFPLVRW